VQITTIQAKGEPVLWGHCPDMPSLAAHYRDHGTNKGQPKGASGWRGASEDDTLRFLATGNNDLVAQSDALMSKLEGSLDFAAHLPRTVAAVAGGAPNVPAYLAGQPLAMRQRRRVTSDLSPIAVIVCMGASSDATAQQIATRGAAVLALTRLLSVSRPTTLVLTSGYNDRRKHMLTVGMDTAPLDLARAAWALTQPEFLRRVVFGSCCEIAGINDGGFSGVPLFRQSAGAPEVAAQALGFSEYVASPRLTGDEFQNGEADAVEWLLKQVNALSALAA
jgi:hypothetical protein